MKFGKHVSDFVFREPPNEYLLVELERPTARLFRSDGHKHHDLNHAIDQIIDWRRYIQDNTRTVQNELGLQGITGDARSLVVIGRSTELTAENRRKLSAIQSETPRLKILTYDDVIESAKTTVENMLGPLWLLPPSAEVYYLPHK